MTNREKAIKGAIKAGYKAFQGANGWYAVKVNKEGFHKQPARCHTGYQTKEDALAGVGSTLDLDWE